MGYVFGAAKWHLQHGISVFPLPAKSKFDPKLKWSTWTERLPTEDELSKWFKGKESNYAVIGGDISGYLVILDFDDPKLVELLLGQSVDTLIEKHYTRIVKSHKGYHIYFRDRNRERISSRNLRNKDPVLSLDVDIKSHHGYVVGPGSAHPDGGTYELLSDVDPRPMDFRGMMDKLFFKNAGYLILSRLIDPVYTDGRRYNVTVALGIFLRINLKWTADRISEFFSFHDKYLISTNRQPHRQSTIKWLINLISGTPEHDLKVGVTLDDDTIKRITKYVESINGHITQVVEDREQDTERGTGITYWFDGENGVLYEGGNIYKLAVGKRGAYEKFMIHIPIELKGVVNLDGVIKVQYRMELTGEERMDTVKDMATHLAVNMKSSRDDNKYITMFLNAYVQEMISNGRVQIMHSSVYIENDVIHMAEGHDTDVAQSLRLLRDFYDITMNQDAYLSAFSYSLTAPLHYYVRVLSPPGYILPHHISVGRTGASKTTTDAIFVLTGWDQDKDHGMLMSNQVKTKYTFMQHMTEGFLPVIINDVAPDWLDSVSEELKSASEAPAIGDRGNPNQTVTHSKMKRSILVTLNADISPSDDAARNRRYILERYSGVHGTRKNKDAYYKFIKEIQPGFLYSIFREIFDGRKLMEVVDAMVARDDTNEFVQYGIDMVNELCRKYGIPEFPKYRSAAQDVEPTTTSSDSYHMLCEYIMGQDERYTHMTDNVDYRGPRPELAHEDFLVEDMSHSSKKDKVEKYNIWFTALAYRFIAIKFRFPYNRVEDFINNYVDNDEIRIIAVNRSKRGLSTRHPVKAYGLEYSIKNTDFSYLKAIRYLRNNKDKLKGDEDLLPYYEAEALIRAGIAQEVE